MSERRKTVQPKKRKRPNKRGRFLTEAERIIVLEVLDTILKYGIAGLNSAQYALVKTKNKELYSEQHSMYAGVVSGARWGISNISRIRVDKGAESMVSAQNESDG